MIARTFCNQNVLGPYRLSVRTHPSQGWKRSSILRRVTSVRKTTKALALVVFLSEPTAWLTCRGDGRSDVSKSFLPDFFKPRGGVASTYEQPT